MPNPPVHINLARRAADHIRHDVIEANMGYIPAWRDGRRTFA